MHSYISTKVSPYLKALHERSRSIVKGIPDIINDVEGIPIKISCHHMTRVVAAMETGLTVVDGNILRGFEHSWLKTSDPDFILDPYPSLLFDGPILVFMGRLSPWREIYSTNSKPTVVDSIQFQDEVERIIETTEGAMRFLSMP